MQVRRRLSSLYAFRLNKQQRKENTMNLMEDVQTALIVDDKEQEVEGLKNMLVTQNIYYTYYSPELLDAQEHIQLKNHQLIFIDFSLNDAAGNVNNIAIIRRYLKKICHNNFGSYGLVVWTKHPEEIDTLRSKLTIDVTKKEYITPLFIICLDKTKYLRNGYNLLFADLNEQLMQDKAAAFFFNWRTSVEQGADKALNDVYSLMPDYTKQHLNFPYFLYLLAHNFSGVHVENNQKYEKMYQDAYKAFDNLLYNDLISEQKSKMSDIFDEVTKNPWSNNDEGKVEYFAKINAKMHIDELVEQTIVVPGNVYHIMQNIDALKSQKKWPTEDFIHIAIELTPPCDIAQNNTKFSRLIGGFIIDCPRDKETIRSYKNKYCKESQYCIYPILIENSLRWICMDFTCIYVTEHEQLRNVNIFKLLFRFKNGLYAEIQRRFVAHAGRLGTSLLTL